MTLPTVDVELTAAEIQLLRPGSDVIAVGLANARRGVFPHRRPWHGVDLVSTAVYPEREYDEAMHRMVIELRARLLETPATGLFSLDAIEFAAAALFLRLRADGAPAPEPAPVEVTALGRKLENFRKRAKRLATRRMGGEQYHQAAATWQRFVEWMRYSLLQFQAPRFRGKALKMIWADQRRRLSQLIEEAIRERCYRPLAPEQLKRMATLAKAALRRGRQPMSLKQVLDEPQAGKQLLFKFVERRNPWLIPALGAELPYAKRALLMEEVFRSRRGLENVQWSHDAPTNAVMEQWIEESLKSWKVPLDAEQA